MAQVETKDRGDEKKQKDFSLGELKNSKPLQFMDCDFTLPWYHGSPLKLTTLRTGSTITQRENLARVFSHKPSLVSVGDDGIKHNGTLSGFLYVVAEEVPPEAVYPHPRTTLGSGDEWLTKRNLRLRCLGSVDATPEELLSNTEIDALIARKKKNHARDSK